MRFCFLTRIYDGVLRSGKLHLSWLPALPFFVYIYLRLIPSYQPSIMTVHTRSSAIHSQQVDTVVVPSAPQQSSVVPATVPEFIANVVVQSGPPSITSLQKATYDLIAQYPNAAAKIGCIRDILSYTAIQTEAYTAVLTEAWNILITNETWRGGYDSLAAAINDLDTPQLKQLRKIFSDGMNRKQRAINTIQTQWRKNVFDWRLDLLGEHHLWQMSNTAVKYSYHEAKELVTRITLQRLREQRTGRGSGREISTKDWERVRLLTEGDAAVLMNTEEAHPDELRSLDIVAGTLTLSHRYSGQYLNPEAKSTGRRRYKPMSKKRRKVVSPVLTNRDPDSEEEDEARASQTSPNDSTSDRESDEEYASGVQTRKRIRKDQVNVVIPS